MVGVNKLCCQSTVSVSVGVGGGAVVVSGVSGGGCGSGTM